MTTALPYASDFSGIVCGFRFAPDAPGVHIASAGALEWPQQSRAERSSNDFVWLHFDLANSASERWMRTQLDLPDAFLENLRDGSHSTRIEHQEGALLAVINDVMFNFDVTPSEIATLWVYTREKLLITAWLKPLRSIVLIRCGNRYATAKPSGRRPNCSFICYATRPICWYRSYGARALILTR